MSDIEALQLAYEHGYYKFLLSYSKAAAAFFEHENDDTREQYIEVIDALQNWYHWQTSDFADRDKFKLEHQEFSDGTKMWHCVFHGTPSVKTPTPDEIIEDYSSDESYI